MTVEVRTARAEECPCELYEYHAPRVIRTQGHHVEPVYLQNRIYGHIENNRLMWVCGNCHDSIHEWLSWLLGEAREPSPHPGWKAKAEAQKAFDWYKAALARKPRPDDA